MYEVGSLTGHLLPERFAQKGFIWRKNWLYWLLSGAGTMQKKWLGSYCDSQITEKWGTGEDSTQIEKPF